MQVHHTRRILLNGQYHEIFDFRFSTWISFPQAPDYKGRFKFLFLGVWGEMIHGKSWSKKSRNTVPLKKRLQIIDLNCIDQL